MKQAGEFGFLSVGIPEMYGGLGMDFVSSMLVCDYISGATGSFSTAFGAHTGIGTLPILLYGTEEHKKYYVPKLASGVWIGAYCLTEPGAGSDANSGKTNNANKNIRGDLIGHKLSNYNSNIYMTECELCESKDNLESHHCEV